MISQLSSAVLIVNNTVIVIVANSLKYVHGLGEQTVRAGSVGNGVVEQVLSDNIETKISKVMFDMHTTPQNIDEYETWQFNRNGNVVGIAGQTPQGRVEKTFTQAVMINDPEVDISTEGVISVEFHANTAM